MQVAVVLVNRAASFGFWRARARLVRLFFLRSAMCVSSTDVPNSQIGSRHRSFWPTMPCWVPCMTSTTAIFQICTVFLVLHLAEHILTRQAQRDAALKKWLTSKRFVYNLPVPTQTKVKPLEACAATNDKPSASWTKSARAPHVPHLPPQCHLGRPSPPHLHMPTDMNPHATVCT